MKNAAKIVAVAATAITGAALVGVGFAAWVIGGKAVASAGGNIQVDTVVNGIDLSASVAENSAVVYGRPALVADSDSLWLSNDGQEEQLTVNLTITYRGKVDGLTIGLGVLCDGVDITEKYSSCITEGLIADYKVEFKEDDTFTTTLIEESSTPMTAVPEELGKYKIINLPETDVEKTVYVQLIFDWGTLFTGNNPVNFFTTFSSDTELIKTEYGILTEGSGWGAKTAKEWAEDTLSRLSSSLTNDNAGESTTFKLTLTAE